MVIVHSASKGLAAMTLAIAHSRGWLDFEERVCTYWPEFAQHGKERITVRQLLAHQAGLFAFDEPVDKELISDLDRLAAVLARQTPATPARKRAACGSSNAYVSGSPSTSAAVPMLMIGTPSSPSEVVTAGKLRLASATAQYASAVAGTAA